MRRMAMLAGAAAVALFASAAPAQTKVINFAGKWVVLDSTALGRGGRGGLGSTVTILQDAGTMTIVRAVSNGEIKSTYKLDGTETRNTMLMGNTSIEQTSKTMWMSDTLMVTNGRLVNGATVESVMNLYLDASGNLVVATLAPARGGGPVQRQVVMYKKGM